MDTHAGTSWVSLASWGSDGRDAGAWPYIIFAAAHHTESGGPLYGYGLYIEGNTETHWFRSQTACHAATTVAVSEFWKSGQSDGPTDLYETGADLPRRYCKPHFGSTPGRETVE